jgi:hypothetical protein
VRDEVEALYNGVLRGHADELAVLDAVLSDEPYQNWAIRLLEVESKIGGIGAHNVNRLTPGEFDTLLGTYAPEDRPIYRSIQYCARTLLEGFVVFDPRYLVDMAGAHVEDFFKLYLRLAKPTTRAMSLGASISGLLLTHVGKDPRVAALAGKAKLLNAVYVLAKHNFEAPPIRRTGVDPRNLEAHTLQTDEAFVTYISARIIGVETGAAMFDRYSRPRSLNCVPVIDVDEFLRIVGIQSRNLRHWEPDLVSGKKSWPHDLALIARRRAIT